MTGILWLQSGPVSSLIISLPNPPVPPPTRQPVKCRQVLVAYQGFLGHRRAHEGTLGHDGSRCYIPHPTSHICCRSSCLTPSCPHASWRHGLNSSGASLLIRALVGQEEGVVSFWPGFFGIGFALLPCVPVRICQCRFAQVDQWRV